jgi:hypothetical protein
VKNVGRGEALKKALKVVGWLVAACVVLYGVAVAGLYAAMRRPPERFGAFMSHVPPVAMMVLPFRPLWMSARAGTLQPGDTAPDFSLPLLKGDRKVTLSEEYRKKPVVLVFGSYT